MTATSGTLWFDLLKAKYFPIGSPMFALASLGSQFWKDLVKVCDVFRNNVSLWLEMVSLPVSGWIGGLVILH